MLACDRLGDMYTPGPILLGGERGGGPSRSGQTCICARAEENGKLVFGDFCPSRVARLKPLD